MKPTVTEVRDFGGAWEIVLTYPSGAQYHRILLKKDYPDELAAYTAIVKRLEEEEQN
jgi:hypothetical protein